MICAYCLSYMLANETRVPFYLDRPLTDGARMLLEECEDTPLPLGIYTLARLHTNLEFGSTAVFLEFFVRYGTEFTFKDVQGAPYNPHVVTYINGTAVCQYHVPTNLNFRHLTRY